MADTAFAVEEVWFKSQRVARTVLQAIIGALPVLIAIVLAAQETVDWAWLGPVLAGSIALQGYLAKVMAIPAVNEWLSLNTGFGSVPKTIARQQKAEAVTPEVAPEILPADGEEVYQPEVEEPVDEQ